MEAIRDYLKATGMTQAQFARRVGVDRAIVTHWMKGKRQPTEYQCFRIWERCGISMDKLPRAK